MRNAADNSLTMVEFVQAFVSALCLGAAAVTVAMALKQWTAAAHLADASYHEILALREDAWLGVSQEADQYLLCLTMAFFVVVALLAAWRRTPVHYVACGICGFGLTTAIIIWAMTPRI